MLVGLVALTAFVTACFWIIHKLYTKHKRQTYERMNIFQYATMCGLLIPMAAMTLKVFMWHTFRIKYVLITPWFNI